MRFLLQPSDPWLRFIQFQLAQTPVVLYRFADLICHHHVSSQIVQPSFDKRCFFGCEARANGIGHFADRATGGVWFRRNGWRPASTILARLAIFKRTRMLLASLLPGLERTQEGLARRRTPPV
jgi:hypothetical protein